MIMIMTSVKTQQKIEYEGLPVICFKCGRYGHHSETCSRNTNDGNPTGDYTNSQDQQRAETTEPQEDRREEANNLEPFGPRMIASKRGRRPNAGKENGDVLNRYRMPPATNSNSNPTTITFKANLSKSATRRQQRKKAALIIQNRPEASTSNNPFPNTASIQDPSNSHINEVHYNSHANPSFIFRPFTHATSDNHTTKSIPITLDPTKHTAVCCSPQPNTPPGQNSDTIVWPAAGHHDRPPPHSSHPNDPPDDMSGFTTENTENDILEHALIETDVVENGMSEDEESIVQETPEEYPEQPHG
ncbi:hypothetical protein WN944_013219 [Citrus x changshan-huyou]|uniref:CCHC-type domain-containing protein n=1 Tax=Citrus x changshan-huyou TaxID=2935761 RepID=A0AAP0QJJ2_9ROSI